MLKLGTAGPSTPALAGPEEMDVRLTGAMLMAATLILSAAAATSAPPFSASALRAVGDSTVEGAAVAVFATLDERGLDWSATAAGVKVHRAHANYTSLASPFQPDAYVLSLYDDRADDLSFGPSTLVSTGARPGGAILVLGLDAPPFVATTRAPLSVAPEEGPRFVQGDPVDQRGNGDATIYLIDERVSGTFLNVTTSDVELVLRGDFQVQVSGVDYRLSSGEGRLDAQTGFRETGGVGTVEQGRAEKHTLTLVDATLRLRVPGTARLVTPDAILTLDGEMRADDPQGALAAGGGQLDESTPAARVRGGVALSPSDGAVHATTGAAPGLAATRVGAPDAGAVPWWLAGALVLLALAGAGGVAAWRRREATDPVQAALLAMEERRWEDALPHLGRALALRPGDVGLLVDRALCFEQTGRLDGARADYEEALRQAPANAEAHLYYARALARLRDPVRALAHLEEALVLDPRLAEIARADAALAGLDARLRR